VQKKHSVKTFFAECKKTLSKETALPSVKKNTRQRRSLPSAKKKYSAKKVFAECFFFALGKAVFQNTF
jgi:hypothetical protein